jgi:hypothetical protein
MIVRKRGPAILDDAGTVVEMSREGKGYRRRNDRAERGRFPAQVSDRSQLDPQAAAPARRADRPERRCVRKRRDPRACRAASPPSRRRRPGQAGRAPAPLSGDEFRNPIETADGSTLLATKAKGIYKPAWSPYALSVRQTLGGPYPDREPIHRPDGTWVYQYFQENAAADERDDEFTNRGLVACWNDGVPVGVMRQLQGKPAVRYVILGVATVAGWDGGYFFFEGANRDGFARERGPTAEFDVLAHEQEVTAISQAAFDPGGIIDARERIAALVVRRRGQPQFRDALLAAYGGRCAVSECDSTEVLEAAHIVPYAGPETNVLGNASWLLSPSAR